MGWSHRSVGDCLPSLCESLTLVGGGWWKTLEKMKILHSHGNKHKCIFKMFLNKNTYCIDPYR